MKDVNIAKAVIICMCLWVSIPIFCFSILDMSAYSQEILQQTYLQEMMVLPRFERKIEVVSGRLENRIDLLSEVEERRVAYEPQR